jgi:hypothetical protein
MQTKKLQREIDKALAARPRVGGARKSVKGVTRLTKPTTVLEWGVIYYEAGELSAEWFDTRAEAVARAEKIYASDVFVTHVVLHGSR